MTARLLALLAIVVIPTLSGCGVLTSVSTNNNSSTTDFIAWNKNKFMSADAASTVPEPGMGVSLIAALMELAVVRRR
jgi:hypothetical protein